MGDNILYFLAASSSVKILSYFVKGKSLKKERIGYVSSIAIHPLKSGRGIDLPVALCTDQGLKHPSFEVFDREFLIVKPNGAFLTSRVLPRISLIECILDVDHIRLQFPNQDSLLLSLKISTSAEKIVSRVWDEFAEGRDCGDEAARWIQKCLETPDIRLVRGDSSLKKRHIVDRKDKWTADADYKDRITFQDRFPFHIASEASLESLNQKLVTPVKMDRFRPNFVISGCTAFDEDNWDNIWIGDAHFQSLKPCQRCLLTTVNPENGTKDGKNLEPLTTLNTYRLVCPDYPKSPIFGVMLVLRSQPGKVTIGDAVYVTRKC